MLLATCCEDDIVPHVLPFIKEHIKNPDWRYRDAAVMAFGCILEGPEPNQLKPLVIQVRCIVFSLEACRAKAFWFVWRRMPALHTVLNLRKRKTMPPFNHVLERFGRPRAIVVLHSSELQGCAGLEDT